MRSKLDCVGPRTLNQGTVISSPPLSGGQDGQSVRGAQTVLPKTATKPTSEPSTHYLGGSAGTLLPLSAKLEPFTTAEIGTEQESHGRVRGTVKFFNVKAGFGFITSAKYQQDIFVHRSAIVAGNPCHRRCSLRDGEAVDFLVVDGDKGPIAVDVTGPEGAAVLGSPYAAEQRCKGGPRGRRRHRASLQQNEVQAVQAPLSPPGSQQEILSGSPLTAEPTVEVVSEPLSGDSSVSYGTVSAICMQVKKHTNDTILSSRAVEYQSSPAVEYLSSLAEEYQTTRAVE